MKTALKLTVLAASATEQRPVAAFSAIELAGPYHVAIDAQAKPSLALSGARKQLAEVETVVRGDTLVVRPVQRNGVFFSFGKRQETVTIHIAATALKRLTVAGSGDVEIVHIGGERFALAGNGPGDVHASGTVRQLSVTSSGSGDLDLRDLKAADVDVALNGPGDARIDGTVAQVDAQIAGSGSLEGRGRTAAHADIAVHGPGTAAVNVTGQERAGARLENRAQLLLVDRSGPHPAR